MPGGQGFTTGQGSVGNAHIHGLRSNKAVTQVSALLGGQQLQVPQGAFGISRAVLLTGIGLTAAQYTFSGGGGGGATWNVGAISVVTGTSGQAAGQFNLAPTLPAGITAGGFFELDAASNPLPAGMTLSSAGLLDVGSAGVDSQSGVVFNYTEPGALPTLTLYNGSVTGTLPYMATVYPTEGAVPSGQVLVSPDDTALRSSVLSAWPDGSAQVVVVAGSRTFAATNSSTSVRVRAGAASGAALTTAAISAVVSSIAVNFGAGVKPLSSFGSPAFTWWANPQVICARYVLAIGLGSMTAVVDVHTFAGGRALVEVQIENGNLNAALTNPAAPAEQTYSNATVAVNGTVIATVSSASAGGATHRPFRSWFCSAWVNGGSVSAEGGAADPKVEVTHDTTYLQSHPVFFRNEKAAAYDFNSWLPQASGGEGTFFGVDQPYSADAYTPWNFGRQRWGGMGGTGGAAAIGHFTGWEARYVQSGNRHTRRATIASALALLGFPVNYRDASNNLPPTFTQLAGKYINSGQWPYEGGWPYANYTPYGWDYAHQPPAGLMAFLCRPSPVFIEVSQKISVFTGLSYYGDGIWARGQIREKAWMSRNLAQAIFITPDASAWKAPAKTSLATNITYMRQYESDAQCSRLNVVAKYSPDQKYYDESGSAAGYNQALWQHCWLATEMSRVAAMKILSGSEQVAAGLFADWCLTAIVRFINECSNGEWRYFGAYTHTLGTNSNGFDVQTVDPNWFSNWSAARNWNKIDASTGPSGALLELGTEEFTRFSDWSSSHFPGDYSSQMFCALVTAKERGTPGADTAWATFNTVSNLAAFRDLAALDSRFNIWPRNA